MIARLGEVLFWGGCIVAAVIMAPLIVAAGMIATPKNAYSILANTIGRVGKFRKVGPGEFELPNSNKEERPLLAEAAHR